jgi:SAM-dependent methyltransferase
MRSRINFHYREWLYSRYIAALVSYCPLAAGSTVRAFFRTFCGGTACGCAASIARAADLRDGGIVFEVADIETAQFAAPFDCIFVRSCSLYNTDKFATSDVASGKLLAHLKPGGTFLFLYNSNFSGSKAVTWCLLASILHPLPQYARARARLSGARPSGIWQEIRWPASDRDVVAAPQQLVA